MAPRPRSLGFIVALLAGAALMGCADDGEEDGVDFVQREDSRLVKVQSVGLAAFGPINPHTATAEHAAVAFGEPSSVDGHGELCRHRWPAIGLTIDFALPGADPCGAQARVERLRVRGRAAAEAGWRTAEGIRPGMSVAAVHRVYPQAHRVRPGPLVLVKPPGARARPVLLVTMANGRIEGLTFPIAAASG